MFRGHRDSHFVYHPTLGHDSEHVNMCLLRFVSYFQLQATLTIGRFRLADCNRLCTYIITRLLCSK